MNISLNNNPAANQAARVLDQNLAGAGAVSGNLSSGERLADPAQQQGQAVESDSVEISGAQGAGQAEATSESQATEDPNAVQSTGTENEAAPSFDVLA